MWPGERSQLPEDNVCIERPFRVRMGINTGFCTVGNFGSQDRMDYTIIGGAAKLILPH